MLFFTKWLWTVSYTHLEQRKMDLTEKLLKIPERENAGARSSNRFTFQQVWAFDYMLKVVEEDRDFVLFLSLIHICLEDCV